MMQRASKSDSPAIGIIHKGLRSTVSGTGKYRQCRYGDNHMSFQKKPLQALLLAAPGPITVS
jgi:hypothetical protein